MIELFLIIVVCLLLTGVVAGHWMVYGGPSLHIFPINRKTAGMSKPGGKPHRQIKTAPLHSHRLSTRGVTVKHHIK